MPLVVWICIGLVTVFFAIQLVSFFVIFREDSKPVKKFKEQPRISLLLAARNEEKLIIRSLTAIANLNYPKDKLEVLIGNDDSSDRTAEMVENFIAQHSNFQLINIHENMGKGRGKANVLAHLAHKATGEFYFITDVDVLLPKEWINVLLAQFDSEVGIVSGTTTCQAQSSLFSKMQSIDWLHFMGYIQSFANMGVACTSVGNNMAVRAKAYWQTGGYENIDFSITEDYKLFKEVTRNGWQWRTIFTTDSLGLASHIDTVLEMLHQRKRWLIGARELPLNWKFLIILYGLFTPALLVLAIFNPMLALGIWFTKYAIQSLYIQSLFLLMKLQKPSLWQLFQYDVYVQINTLATAIFYFLPIKSVWKERTYDAKYLE
ncbi:MAG: glycosyltransferase [Flavobacteriales bacterium]|nr:glycosyltransferase [Flavobacteriales bacterium]